MTLAGGKRWQEVASAKLNLALHVREKLPDGRHGIETLFAFCTDGDELSGEDSDEIELYASGPFAEELGPAEDNLVTRAAKALREASGAQGGAKLHLVKSLPVASGIGGASADAAAALRLLTAMWNIDPAHAEAVAPSIGSDVPACLWSRTALGFHAGDRLEKAEDEGIAGTAVLLVNPRVRLSTAEVYSRWNGTDGGPLGDWRHGRNDLEPLAIPLAPQISAVLAWLGVQPGAGLVRMSGSGATCFALFEDEASRDEAAEGVPREWWRLPTTLR